MGDLAGIEGYADEVILLHRQQASDDYDEKDDYVELVELTLAKWAGNASNLVKLGLMPQYACFVEIEIGDTDS